MLYLLLIRLLVNTPALLLLLLSLLLAILFPCTEKSSGPVFIPSLAARNPNDIPTTSDNTYNWAHQCDCVTACVGCDMLTGCEDCESHFAMNAHYY